MISCRIVDQHLILEHDNEEVQNIKRQHFSRVCIFLKYPSLNTCPQGLVEGWCNLSLPYTLFFLYKKNSKLNIQHLSL